MKIALIILGVIVVFGLGFAIGRRYEHLRSWDRFW